MSVNAADTDRLGTLLSERSNDFLIGFSDKNHLRNAHCLRIGHTEAILELRRNIHSGKHIADVRSAAVNDNRIDSDELQKSDVIHDGRFELLVDHRVAAILYNDRFARQALNIRERFNQDSCFVDEFLHLFSKIGTCILMCHIFLRLFNSIII